MGGKSKAPKGPDYKKLLAITEAQVASNEQMFGEMMEFNKEQFTAGKEYADGILKLAQQQSASEKAYQEGFLGIAKDQLGLQTDFYNEFLDFNEKQLAQNQKVSDELTGTLLPGVKDQAALGQTLRDRYREQGLPFEDEYLKKITTWDTGARREERAGSAVGDVAMATEAAREAELRRLEGYGIDPSQTRSAALDSRLQTAAAIAKAAAANNARLEVEREGLALGNEAVNLNRASLGDAGSMTGAAAGQAGVVQGIAAAPGAAAQAGMAQGGGFLGSASQYALASGGAGFDMLTGANRTGATGQAGAAGQSNASGQFGMSAYTTGSGIRGMNIGAVQGAYGTANDIYANNLERYKTQQENSFGGALGSLAGSLGPAALGSPWFGATKVAGMFEDGGHISPDMSPSRGAIPDDTLIAVTADEYIMDRDTVRWHGIKNLKKLQDDAKKNMGSGIPAPA